MRESEKAFLALVSNELQPLRNIAEKLGYTYEMAFEFSQYLIKEKKIRGKYIPIAGHGDIFLIAKEIESEELILSRESVEIAKKLLTKVDTESKDYFNVFIDYINYASEIVQKFISYTD